MKKVRKQNEPVRVNEDVWFYVNPKTLQFVVWTEGEPGERQCRQFAIKRDKLKPFV